MGRKIPSIMFFSMFCCLVSLCKISLALENTDEYSLGEIVVSGKAEGVQATQSVYNITAEDIENKGARTLEQAISLLPGVNVRVGGEGVPRIDIRGFRTRHIVLLLDGIPINSAFDGQFDPTIVPTENIAKIKMTQGASSVLYGQGGLGGVINIITKKGKKGFQGMIAGETGDHEPYLGRASISGGKDKFDYFLSGSSSNINCFPLSDYFRPTSEQPAGYRKNSDKERNNVFANIGFNPTNDLNLGLTFSYSQGKFGKPGSSIKDPYDPFASPPKYERIDDFEGVSVQLAADYDVTSKLSVRGWAFLHQLEQRDNLYDNGDFNSFNLVTGSFQEHVRTSIKGVTLQPRYDIGKAGVVTFSFSTEWDNWRNSGVTTTAPNEFSPLNADKSYSLFSTSVEYELSPLKGLGLVAGYGHFWQFRRELDEDAYSLLAGAYYDLFRDTRLKASYKRNIRFPTLSDLYDLSKGNPDLVSERSYSWEAGVEQKLPLNSMLSLTGFHTIAKNLIQNDQTVGVNMNLPEIDFDGFEISAATQLLKGLLLRASYTYLDSKDKSRAGRDQQQYTPRDKVTLEGKYDFDCGFSSYASLLYVGNQYFYTKNSVTPVQRARMKDFALVNIKLSQKLLDSGVNLYFGVNNIFDQDYETSYGFPQAGRFIYGGIEFRFGA